MLPGGLPFPPGQTTSVTTSVNAVYAYGRGDGFATIGSILTVGAHSRPQARRYPAIVSIHDAVSSSASSSGASSASAVRQPVPSASVTDPAALVDLLGALAYGELSAFDRLSRDAQLAPTLGGRAALSDMACVEMGHYRSLVERLTSLGANPEAAMAPFVAALDLFHDRTEPSTWFEGLVKAYVGDGLGADFYREVAEFVNPSTRALIIEVLADTGSSAFAVREVRAGIAANPALAGRLALWGRRLVGEAISQTQHVLAERDALMMLLIGGAGDLAGATGLINRITGKHSERMAELGLGS
jgi:hypothetical protein